MFTSRKVKAFFVTMLAVLLIPNAANAATYTVVRGDSLFTIGNRFNTTSSALMRENNLTSTVIHPGQRLRVPSSTYTVRSGDSLFLIARRFGITVDSLRRANNKWDNTIHPGQTLILPGTASTQSAAVTTMATTTAAATSPARAVISYSASDLDLLARLIKAEADGESYQAKVAVGGVVVNRVRDSRFPNTIASVIYERANGYYQFCPVQNGWINRPASEDSKRAASEALHGSDPSRGAFFFYDGSATNQWIRSRPFAVRIGRLTFVY